MPMAVINPFEVIQINKQYRQPGVMTFTEAQGHGDTIGKQATVESGQGIM